jgi:hypothetical protein
MCKDNSRSIFMSELQPDAKQSLPGAISLVGWLALPGALIAVTRLFYEQGLLTWRQGPQMVGFSLIHVHPGLFAFMLGSILLAHIYLLLACAAVLWRASTKKSTSALSWLQIAVAIACVGVFYIPYSAWQVAVIKFGGSNGNAREYMSMASALGEKHVVRAVLEEGISPDIKNRNGQTALDVACAANKTEMVAYLLSKGANRDLAPHCPGSRAKSKAIPELNTDMLHVPGEVVEVH